MNTLSATNGQLTKQALAYARLALAWAAIPAWLIGWGRSAEADVLAERSYPVQELHAEGLERTSKETILDLLPRNLPATYTGNELLEFRRRVKNLALFDQVEVDARGAVLVLKVRRKTTIAPIVDLSTGKSLADTKVTLGAVEHDIDGHGSRLGAKGSYSERGLNFSVWFDQHVYRPHRWAGEYDIFYAGSAFRFEGADAARKWHRNRFGAGADFLSPFSYGAHFRYELQLNAYGERLTVAEGTGLPGDGVYLGPTSEFIYDRYSFHDLTPSGYRLALELRPGVFLGPNQARHEVRLKGVAAMKLAEYTALVFSTSAAAVNTGNPNHSGLVGSQQGVRGLPDALYRTRSHVYANLELRQGLSLGKRWYLQGVVFSDVAAFEPMNAEGEPTRAVGAWSAGVGLRILPTALVDTLLRIDGARLFFPTGTWFVQFGISQYI